MSLEELTKTQLILLVLLICFISSIATSIITTGLLAEAPIQTTQTINRIVQNTVEKVVPSTDSVVPEQIVISDSELISSVYENSTFSIYKIKDDKDFSIDSFSVDSKYLISSYFENKENLYVLDNEISKNISYKKTISGLVLVSLSDESMTFNNSLVKETQPKVGESVVVIDPVSMSVFDSRISNIDKSADGSMEKIVLTQDASVFKVSSVVLDLEGKVMGFVGIEGGVYTVVPVSKILSI